jgi:hypothetical protein
MADLVICKLSHCSASVAGGDEVILLCEKVAKGKYNFNNTNFLIITSVINSLYFSNGFKNKHYFF